MKLMKLLAVIPALFIVGCVRSVHPIYTSSDVVSRDEVVGTWRQPGKETTWQFTESKDDDRDRAYRLVLTDEKGRPGTFLAHLVKLENEYFLDLFPVAPSVADNNANFYKFHFQRVHTFLHVRFEGESLIISFMNPNWLEKHLKNDPRALAHTAVTPSGHSPSGDEENAAERLLLTASTAELQEFLLKHVNSKQAFGAPVNLRKIQ